MTYSINTGSSTEAFGWNDINIILNELPDNTSNLITPHNLRDAAYTVWQGIGIKPTKNSANIEYLGIEQNNLYEKIFLGKKQVSGVDVLSSNLLNSDFDIFIYNTKTDGDLTKQNTKIGLLAGASTSVFYYGNTFSFPYLGSKVITNSYGNVLDMEIANTSYVTNGATNYGGNISILSKYGNVLINGIVFPTYAQNIPGIVPDNSVLTYKNIGGSGYAQWSANNTTVSSITASGTFSINASKILLNGFDAFFTDTRPTTATFGSIVSGSTFNNISVVEMLRMMLYGYVAPKLILTTSANYIEVNSLGATLGLSYSITKVVATSSIISINTIPFFQTGSASTYLNAAPIINRVYNATSSYTSGTFYSTPGLITFTLSVIDNINGTVSTNCSANVVYPIFYGTSYVYSSTQSVVQSLLSSFNKIITNDVNQTVPISGTGVCIYYCVPSIYNVGATISSVYDTSYPLNNIKNNFGVNGIAFTMSLSSPSSYWGSTLYNCYIYSISGTVSVVPTLGVYPTYGANYQFSF